MNLIHIVHGNAIGGAQRYALDICRHFAEAGADVTALTREARAVDLPFKNAGVSLAHAPLRDYPDFFSSLTLKNILKEKRGETIVHVHRYRDALTAITARKLSKRPDVKVIITRHISEPAKNNWLRRFIYRQVDAHIFVSEFSRKEFLSTWPRGRYPFDPARMHVVHDSRDIASNPLPEPDKGAITAMYHGTIRGGKGLDTLLRAFARMRDTRMRLKIAGSGDIDYVDRLRSLAITLGIMDSIDWRINPPDPAELIPSCHFGVLPSEMPEACGMANIEYMAAGRPQICTFNSAQVEYMTPGVEALKVEPGDITGLEMAMRKLFSDKELRLKMGAAAAKSFSDNLSWPRFIERITTIYTSSL